MLAEKNKNKTEFKRKKGQARGRHIDPQALNEIRALLGEAPRQRDCLIEYLHKIQDKYNFISAAHLVALADEMKLAQSEVYEVATFYHHFDVIKEDQKPPLELTVRVCNSISCEMSGSVQLISQLEQHLGNEVRIQTVPCVGRCAKAPVAVVKNNPLENATVDRIKSLIESKQIEALMPVDYIDYASYKMGKGYKLLSECVQGQHSVDDIIQLLEDSNLRGLGGAGFPMGRKWSILRNQPSPRYVAINIDEGEPGTFKDRYYLERDPHRFIEGALIAAWAIDAEVVYIYIRDEYTGIRKMLEKELALLKENPSVKLPEIHLRRGAGAYICGEESAMIESIEGKRGMPRLRPPYLAEVGLFGRPTLEHNMESLYWVRDIIQQGSDWFTSHGRHGRKGLRSFSVSGRVNKPGVHLAPAGTTVRELIDEYCDGMLDGHTLYGYFPGGASGGILPASLDNIPLDFDTLQEYGCFIGSAAIIIMSDKDSARKMALNAMRFFEHESCGQCTPCRVGTSKAVKLMEQKSWNILLLKELSTVMVDASICGLGQAAPNPLLCAIKYFPQEFE